MDDGFTGLIRRRWVLVVSALVFSLIATVGAYMALPSTYQSTALLTMTSPSRVTGESGNFGNPLLALGNDSTALLVDVDFLTRDLSSPTTATQLKALGMTESYTAAFASNAVGPFMQLTVSGKSKAGVSHGAMVLAKYAQQRWLAIQQASSAQPDSIIGLSLIAPPSAPTASLKRKLEEVIGVGLVLLTVSLMVVAQVDGSMRRRQTRSQETTDAPWPGRPSHPTSAR